MKLTEPPELLTLLEGLLACANTLVAVRYRGRQLGGAEQEEYGRVLALMRQGRRLCAKLSSEPETLTG